MKLSKLKNTKRGLYLLPSFFTLLNLVLGFWAIVKGLEGDFKAAAFAIYFAVILDGLDGRIARLLKHESEFGKEFDSLSDVVTFGTAPAVLTFQWGLKEVDRIGWFIALFYLACGAMRLARFNVRAKVIDSRYFIGLPIPAAAGVVVSLLAITNYNNYTLPLVAVSLLVTAFLMISTIKYPSFKQENLKTKKSFKVLVPILGVIFLLIYEPLYFFVTSAFVYVLTGPSRYLFSKTKHLLGTVSKASKLTKVEKK